MNIDLYENSRLIKELKYNDFKLVKKNYLLKENSNIPVIMNFYLPTCKHCKKIVELWNELSIRFNNDFKFYSINCDDIDNNNDILCKKLKIKEYPSILFSIKSNLNKYQKYRGRIDKDNLYYFISYYI